MLSSYSSHGKTTLLRHIAERKIHFPANIDVLLCEQEVRERKNRPKYISRVGLIYFFKKECAPVFLGFLLQYSLPSSLLHLVKVGISDEAAVEVVLRSDTRRTFLLSEETRLTTLVQNSDSQELQQQLNKVNLMLWEGSRGSYCRRTVNP